MIEGWTLSLPKIIILGSSRRVSAPYLILLDLGSGLSYIKYLYLDFLEFENLLLKKLFQQSSIV